jgi:hypothetical protein
VPVQIYKPKNLNLNDLILSQPEFFLRVPKHFPDGKITVIDTNVQSKKLIKYVEYGYFLVHLILSKSYLTKEFNSLVNVHKIEITSFIPNSSYLVVIQLLEQLGVIEVNEKYSTTHGFSKSYSVNPVFYNQELEPLTITSKVLLKNIAKAKAIEVKPVGEYMAGRNPWLLERDKLMKEKYFIHQKKSLEKIQLPTFQTDTDDIFTTNKNIFSVYNLQFKRVNITEKCRKVTHPILNMPRALRSQLGLIEYDFQCSAGLHFSKLIDFIIAAKDIPLKQLTEVDIKLGMSNILTPSAILQVCQDRLTRGFTIAGIDYTALAAELIDFKALVSSPSMYNELITLLAVTNKEEAKMLFITKWFYRSKKINGSIDALKLKFSEIEKLLSWFNSNKKDYTLASILLKSESNLVNIIIIDRIATEYPSSIALNLNDCILTDCIDSIRIIEKLSSDYFGFEPIIKIKNPQAEPVGN